MEHMSIDVQQIGNSQALLRRAAWSALLGAACDQRNSLADAAHRACHGMAGAEALTPRGREHPPRRAGPGDTVAMEA